MERWEALPWSAAHLSRHPRTLPPWVHLPRTAPPRDPSGWRRPTHLKPWPLATMVSTSLTEHTGEDHMVQGEAASAAQSGLRGDTGRGSTPPALTVMARTPAEMDCGVQVQSEHTGQPVAIATQFQGLHVSMQLVGKDVANTRPDEARGHAASGQLHETKHKRT